MGSLRSRLIASTSVVLVATAMGACETRETALRDAGTTTTTVEGGTTPIDSGATTPPTHDCVALCDLAHTIDPVCETVPCVAHCVQDRDNANSHGCADERAAILDCAQAPTTHPKCETPGYVVLPECDTQYDAYSKCMEDDGGHACVVYGSQPTTDCSKCANTSCCELVNACSDLDECGKLVLCIRDCPDVDGGGDCPQACGDVHQGGIDIYNALIKCLGASCDACN